MVDDGFCSAHLQCFDGIAPLKYLKASFNGAFTQLAGSHPLSVLGTAWGYPMLALTDCLSLVSDDPVQRSAFSAH